MNVLPADKEVENVHALHLGDNHVIARCRTTSGCVKLYFYKVSGDLLFFLNLPRFYEYCKERNYFNYYYCGTYTRLYEREYNKIHDIVVKTQYYSLKSF